MKTISSLCFFFWSVLFLIPSCKSDSQKEIESHQVAIGVHYDFAYMYKCKAEDALLQCLEEVEKRDSTHHISYQTMSCWLKYDAMRDSAEKNAAIAADHESAMISLLR